jgi:hypothetical protein
MAVTLNASTSTGLVQTADTSGEIELQSNGTTALKVNTNEGIQILNCLGVGNATPSTSGAGITFPATQSASTDANTLDDYEEGTFTATLTASTPPTTPVTTTATYTKVGRIVTVTINFSNVNTTGASGALSITGLPFSALDVAIGTPPMLYSLPSSGTYNVFYIGGTIAYLYYIQNAGGWSQENISAGTGKYVYATFTYSVS